MKKIFSLFLVAVLMVILVPVVTSACPGDPQPGWWVKQEGKEDGIWTNIEDDIDAKIQQYCEEYCIPGKDGKDGKDGRDGIDGKDGRDGIDGKDGRDGVDGKDGKDGVGVPTGGTEGQALVKTGDGDYETGWADVVTPNQLQDALDPINQTNQKQDKQIKKIKKTLVNHEGRISTLEECCDQVNEELETINGKNEEQDRRLDGVEAKNEEQDGRLDGHDQNISDLFNGQDVQDSRLDGLEHWADYTNQRMDQFDNRLSDLEESQFIFGLNVRIKDTKKTTWEAFADYSFNREKIDRYGIRLTVKMGKSYEEQLIEQLQAQIEELRAKIK